MSDNPKEKIRLQTMTFYVDRESAQKVGWEFIPDQLNVAGVVEGIQIPYIIDEREYHRRIRNRDDSRKLVREREERFRKLRKGSK